MFECNSNKNCPVTIIFHFCTLITQTTNHRKKWFHIPTFSFLRATVVPWKTFEP